MIAHDFPRNPHASRGLLQLLGDQFAVGMLGRKQRQQTHVLLPQRPRRRGQFAQPQSHDHTDLHAPNLHRVVNQVNPIVGHFQRLLEREQPQSLLCQQLGGLGTNSRPFAFLTPAITRPTALDDQLPFLFQLGLHRVMLLPPSISPQPKRTHQASIGTLITPSPTDSHQVTSLSLFHR